MSEQEGVGGGGWRQEALVIIPGTCELLAGENLAAFLLDGWPWTTIINFGVRLS